MSATDYETLYEIEDAIEVALRDAFTSEGLNPFTQRDDAPVATPYTAVQCQLGSGTRHFHVVNGCKRNDWWAATIGLRLVTNRSDDAEKSAELQHRKLRAKIRKAMYANPFTDARMPYHYVPNDSIIESGSSPSVQAEDDLDVSTITFDIEIAIRPNAWPSTTT